MVHRVLDASQGVVVNLSAGCADDKEVSDVLIKDDLGRRPRISATDNNGKRMLILRRFRAASGNRFADAHFALSKAIVAGLQAGESLIGRNGRSCWISGRSPAA